MQLKHLIILTLFIASAIFYYYITDPIQTQTTKATQIIDGDTIKIETGQTIRLVGINAPEKSMPFYNEAKKYLLSSFVDLIFDEKKNKGCIRVGGWRVVGYFSIVGGVSK